ncbi:hypothetical protein MUK42_24175 [Musa troglodytarum]|uniref:Endoplasmic reticulum transmembrane protein n=1 Tax=Musa troglodytarum TaxID=320322 RepID=A0A9E7JKT1_9LILI|nr:hypothetical protein MUK42_24175 [Musa troglodytarum]
MGLQWVILGAVVAAEVAVAALLILPAPRIIKSRIVALASLFLQPGAGILPFAAFQLLDLHWKNEHRLMCASDVCTIEERTRFEKSILGPFGIDSIDGSRVETSISEFLCKAPDFDSRYCVLAYRRANFLSFDPRTPLSTRCLKGYSPIAPSKQGQRRFGVRASSSASSESSLPIAPVQLESPIGQFLYQILFSNSYLLPDSVDQQLMQLDREADESKEEPRLSGTDTTLYRRIAEVKENERRRALEDILYALVVQKFVEAGVSLVHALSRSDDPFGSVDLQSLQEEKLERLHSSDAYAMIESQVELIMTQHFSDSECIPPVSKLRVGNIYAACVKYGCFLKRVDQRFQLEKSLKQATPDESRPSTPDTSPQLSSFFSPCFNKGGCGCRNMSSRLLLYASSFDFDTL